MTKREKGLLHTLLSDRTNPYLLNDWEIDFLQSLNRSRSGQTLTPKQKTKLKQIWGAVVK